MPDNGIKKVVVPKSSLPDVTKDNKYLIRYRIVTEDKNRVSGWSPVFSLNAKEPENINVEYVIDGRIISMVWEDLEPKPGYDIFVKFDGGQYMYHGSTRSKAYTLISQGLDSFSFIIQVSSISKTVSEVLKIFESTEISLV